MNTYPATLRDGRIEWGENGAPIVPPNQDVLVEVRIMPQPLTADERRTRLAALFETYMVHGGLQLSQPEIDDWVAGFRTDRPLPGRDE